MPSSGSTRAGVSSWLSSGTAILLLPAALGASVRYRSASRAREIDQVKLLEREQLGARAARHRRPSRVGHRDPGPGRPHGGRDRPGGGVGGARGDRGGGVAHARRDAHDGRRCCGRARSRRWPRSAAWPTSRCLAEPGRRRARRSRSAPSGDLDDLTPSVDAAVYRLAQESITNAMRHARRATQISVAVDRRAATACA